MIPIAIIIIVIGLFFLGWSYTDYMGEGGGIRNLIGVVLLFIGAGYLAAGCLQLLLQELFLL